MGDDDVDHAEQLVRDGLGVRPNVRLDPLAQCGRGPPVWWPASPGGGRGRGPPRRSGAGASWRGPRPPRPAPHTAPDSAAVGPAVPVPESVPVAGSRGALLVFVVFYQDASPPMTARIIRVFQDFAFRVCRSENRSVGSSILPLATMTFCAAARGRLRADVALARDCSGPQRPWKKSTH
jgi:hypothetical protein